MAEKINRLVVIGLGLIGSGLAKAARDRGLCNEVIGSSRSPETLVKAINNGVVDRVVESIEDIAPKKKGKSDKQLKHLETIRQKSIEVRKRNAELKRQQKNLKKCLIFLFSI